MQSNATADTLKQNALGAGYAANDIEEREVDAAGYAALLAMDPDEIARKAAQAAQTATNAAKAQAIIDNLPSWKQVSGTIDAATTLAELKLIVKKLARVQYWLAKGTQS